MASVFLFHYSTRLLLFFFTNCTICQVWFKYISLQTRPLNPILHGRGRKVVALISIVENFGEIQAIVMKLSDFSLKFFADYILAK